MEHSQIREQVRKMHQEMGILLSQIEAATVPATADPLEGKAVEGFNGGAVIYGEHQLIFAPYFKCWAVAVKSQTTPHHLTRVTERTIGRFYLVEGQDGSQPFHFGLYLGDKYVRWANSEVAPVNIVRSIDRLTMYEVTPTV